jgi:hypothetical protein
MKWHFDTLKFSLAAFLFVIVGFSALLFFSVPPDGNFQTATPEILAKLLLNASLRTQLGKQTRLHARKTYAPTVIANKFLPYIT